MTERHRAYEMPRTRMFGNFRTESWQRPVTLPRIARRRGNDPAHLVLVRRLSCAVCPVTSGIDAHHLKSGPAKNERGLGMKATNRHVCPLCRYHHDEVEALASTREPEWYASYGYSAAHNTSPYAYVLALYRCGSNEERMRQVHMAYKAAAARAREAQS